MLKAKGRMPNAERGMQKLNASFEFEKRALSFRR